MEDLERSAEAFDLNERFVERAQLRSVPDVHERGVYEWGIKPVLDRLAGITLSLITLPLVLVIVPLIWATLGRPAVFKQQRIGRYGREFTVFKFRTMQTDRRSSVVAISHNDRRVNHKSTADPRHTDLGRFLRKWSLDEIPQLWNVALGDMSLIGPRPELPLIVARYEVWQHRRHEVKPGLTGLWQVTARGDAPMHEATDIDVAYVNDVSFLNDAKIMLRTPAAVLGSKQGQ
ncbi:MAG: sugar transferase [Actinomycetota bacterium]|nr:sugar transferase [Actinomycetota bacterium]